MAINMRKNHDSAFKAKVAMDALKAEKTMAQISRVNTGFMSTRSVSAI